MKSSLSTLALLLLGLFALEAEAGLLRRSEDLALPAAGIERLKIGNGSGLLDCLGEDRDDVAIELVFKANAGSREKAQSMLDRSSLGILRDGDELRLKPDLPGGKTWVDILIRMPRHLALVAEIGSGEMRLRGLAGELEIGAGSGSIDGRDLSGRIEAELGSGELELRDLAGQVKVRSSSGDILLTRLGSCDVKTSTGDVEVQVVGGRCRIETGSGDIELRRVDGSAELESGSGDIKASALYGPLRSKSGSGDQVLRGLGAEGQDLQIHSGSGDLDLSFLADASYELQLETRTGEVSARIPMTVRKITRRLLEARMGGGRDRARIETSSGDIRIRATEETR